MYGRVLNQNNEHMTIASETGEKYNVPAGLEALRAGDRVEFELVKGRPVDVRKAQ